MKKLTIVYMLAALASPTLYAQTPPPSPPPQPPVRQDIQSDVFGAQIERYGEVADGNRRAHQAKMIALRAKLAEDWQSLGLPKDAAQQLAAAYQPKGKSIAPRTSLQGKSKKEIAAMLQSALAKKDYMLANEMLIEFERKKLHDTTAESSDSQN